MSFWAQDKWFPGDLVDQDRPWAARDKVQHLVAFGILWLLLALLPGSMAPKLVLWHFVSVGVELVEWAGLKAAWSSFADRPSYRDLVVNEVALGLATLYLAVLR